MPGQVGALAAMVLVSSSPALAQRSPNLVEPGTPCELHLFVTDRVAANSKNAVGGMIGALLQGGIDDAENLEKLQTSLSVPLIMEALAELDLPARLEMPAATIVVAHPEPVSKEQLRAKVRLPGPEIACRVEFAVMQQTFEQHAVWGGLLHTLFEMRTYVRGKQVNFANRLIMRKAKLLGKSGSDPAMIRAEIGQVFKDNVAEFVGGAAKPLRRRKPPGF